MPSDGGGWAGGDGGQGVAERRAGRSEPGRVAAGGEQAEHGYRVPAHILGAAAEAPEAAPQGGGQGRPAPGPAAVIQCGAAPMRRRPARSRRRRPPAGTPSRTAGGRASPRTSGTGPRLGRTGCRTRRCPSSGGGTIDSNRSGGRSLPGSAKLACRTDNFVEVSGEFSPWRPRTNTRDVWIWLIVWQHADTRGGGYG